MGRNTHSKRTKRNKRTRAKLVEPWTIREHQKLHDELAEQVRETVAPKVEGLRKPRRVTVTME
jgi:pantothenate kinase type III